MFITRFIAMVVLHYLWILSGNMVIGVRSLGGSKLIFIFCAFKSHYIGKNEIYVSFPNNEEVEAMSSFWTGFVIGLLIGCAIGVFGICLLVMSRI
jgi:hypothetical protein